MPGGNRHTLASTPYNGSKSQDCIHIWRKLDYLRRRLKAGILFWGQSVKSLKKAYMALLKISLCSFCVCFKRFPPSHLHSSSSSFSLYATLVVTAKQLLRHLVLLRHDFAHHHNHETIIYVVMVTDDNRNTLGAAHCSINPFKLCYASFLHRLTWGDFQVNIIDFLIYSRKDSEFSVTMTKACSKDLL